MNGERIEALFDWLRGLGVEMWEDHKRDLVYAVAAGVWGVVRLAGRTVQSGSIGLKFSFGRATRECQPGFHALIPVFQTIQTVPSRARTLHVPRQRLTTVDGLVYRVDATLVYRVSDVRKALIEVDDYEKAMPDVLSLGVREVLGGRQRSELHVSEELDSLLVAALQRRLDAWGLSVDRAGFATITPEERTIRVTQLAARVAAREKAVTSCLESGLTLARAQTLVGSSARLESRTRALRRVERASRSDRHRRRALAAPAAERARPKVDPGA